VWIMFAVNYYRDLFFAAISGLLSFTDTIHCLSSFCNEACNCESICRLLKVKANVFTMAVL